MDSQDPEYLNVVVGAFFSAHFGAAPTYQETQHYASVFLRLLEEEIDNPAAFPDAVKALSALMFEDRGGAAPAVDDEAFVTQLYQSILGRAPDAGGLQYWVNELATGQAERAELAALMIASALEHERDAAYLVNRTAVALAFGQWENSNPNVLPWLGFDGEEILAGVNEDDATVAAAVDRLPASQPRTGEVFELTPDVDVVEGTAGDDVINAYWVGRNGEEASTLTLGDLIDGGDGIDILNVYADARGEYNSIMPAGALVRNVEVVNLFHLAEGVSGLADASLYEGLQELWQFGNVSAVTNLQAQMVAGFRDVGGEVVIDVQAAATADRVNMVLDHVADDMWNMYVRGSDSAVSTFTLNIDGTIVQPDDDPEYRNSIVTEVFLHDDTSALVVNSVASLQLYVVQEHDTLTSLDASGSTGNILFTPSENTRSVTLGQGDDHLIFWGYVPTLGGLFDGGAGDNALDFSVSDLSADDYVSIRAMHNFQRLGFLHDFATVDAAELTDFKGLVMSMGLHQGDGAEIPFDPDARPAHITVANLASDQVMNWLVYSVYDDGPGSLVLVDPANSIIVETKALDIEGEARGRLVVESSAQHVRDTLTLQGSLPVSYDNRGGLFSTVDASALEGGLTLVGEARPEEFGPSTGMSSSVRETVLLGDGEDWVALGVSFDEAELSSSTVGLMDVIVGFNSAAGEDIPQDRLLGFSQLSKLDLSDDINTLEQALRAAATHYQEGPDGEVGVVFFHFENNTYLYADTWTSAGAGLLDDNDFAIQLTGIHDFSTYDFGLYVPG